MSKAKWANEIIPRKIIDLYGEHLWYSLALYVREMDQCIKNLKSAIGARDFLRARDVLHQMLGATRIMYQGSLESSIISVSERMKSNDYEDRFLSVLLQDLVEGVDGIFQYLMRTRPQYNILMLDPSELFYDSFNQLCAQKVSARKFIIVWIAKS